MRLFVQVIYVSFLLIFSSVKILAQDIHFSQYIHSPLNLSPAGTGFFNGDVRANAVYRSQWNSVTVPYETFSLAYDQVVGKIAVSGSRNAVGILVNNDRAGDGNLGTLQVLASFARLFSIGEDSIHFINVGIQGGFSYRNIDFNKLTFDNQFNGDVYNATISSGEQFEKDNYIYPEFNAGIAWLGLFENTQCSAGLSMQHLNKPGISFLNETVKLPVHWQVYSSVWLRSEDMISFNPSIIYMGQEEFRELTGGMEIKVNLNRDVARNYSFGAGLHYRFDDAIIPSAAVYYNQWRLGLSYDINVSDLKRASNGHGGPEFNVTYIMKKIRYNVRKNNCPVY